MLAATARVAGDLDLAEECVQDAYAAALTAWTRQGVPRNTGAWLTTAARRRAIDAKRRDAVLRAKLPLLIEPDPPVASSAPPGAGTGEGDEVIPDDRLRLIFTCCHPALAREAQVALTLRLVCGLTTVEIAQAFLVSEPTMAARVTRAKKKISAARIAYRVPGPAELPDRLDAVLTVVHLLYTTGHTAPGGENLVRADLVDRAIALARMLRTLMPDEREVAGLLALILLTDARRATRADAAGPAAAAGGAGPVPVGPRRDRRGHRAGPVGAAGRRPGPLRPASGDRRAARRGPQLRRDRLAADRRALRRAAAGLEFSRGGAQPCRRGGHGAGPGGGTGPDRGTGGGSGGWTPTATCPRPRPTCCAAWASGRRRRRPTVHALALTDNAAEREFLTRRLTEVTGTRA